MIMSNYVYNIKRCNTISITYKYKYNINNNSIVQWVWSRMKWNRERLTPVSLSTADSSSEEDSHLKISISSEHEILHGDDNNHGLLNLRALSFLILWYLFSACTLFLNKYILTYLKGDATVLGMWQLFVTTGCGFLQMRMPCTAEKRMDRHLKPRHFILHMTLVGVLRFMTVVLSLVSLKFVAVSFTETVKSSAPMFTVLISRCILGEKTGILVNLSLVPIMSGLALCSVTELSFNMKGFLAAISTNIAECLQNVYSKMLISGEGYKYTPTELQFYTSLASVFIQIPASYYLVDPAAVGNMMTYTVLPALFINGLCFHCQSFTAYVLMGYISPVTYSVTNTTKRAFLIWLSVVMFGNPVTFLSGLGTTTVLVGVLCYSKAREYYSLHKERVIFVSPEKLIIHR